MSTTIKIGTQESPLSLWQANAVKQMLEKLGHKIEIVSLKSIGDFAQVLDNALLYNKIDIAVHSLNDVSTILPDGIVQAAVLKRGNFKDVLVFKNNEEFLSQRDAIIAVGNSRHRAQWLNRYPTHTIVDLSGDLNTQLQKLEDNNDWNAAIFSAAALGRLGLKPKDSINLDWMIPSPAQGAIIITTLKGNEEIREICADLNHEETEICTGIERAFLNLLDGDSSSPIGALTFIKEDEVTFKGVLLSPDGSKKIEVNRVEKLSNHHEIASYCADFVIERGGKSLMDSIARSSKQANIYSTKTLTTDQRLLFNENVIAESSDFVKISLNRIKPQVVRNPIDNVIIANKHSVEALLHNFSAAELQFKNIYCVGRRTKRLIEKRIGPVKHVEKSTKALAEYLVEYIDGIDITYFCGDSNEDELSTILSDNNIKVNKVEAYQIKYDAEKVEDSVEGVMFHSPLTIKSYLKENDSDKIAFCIGETTATEAKKKFKDVRAAKLPTVESIIDLVNENYT
ncbi:hydroxymethylbilane synthase [Flavobacteriaceae bacterium S0825]|uniref:hydroxymethylbilane synthase n=1 Tax=Gaetbulibacter sp. S0825 TaxID=2720084 RepID=UPI0014314268|nr:hydroxymethylbilane synthase [Gaetbulibacter sp. S0825]MCK0108354.1 hydroxymethylbilane synthase [Flavobacteriaceae bacterium S0825]NIX63990.1 hydroxymethylbilane synthase [Gaetbulibacter sp. S0825]